MFLEVEVARIVLSEHGDDNLIILKEKSGMRTVSISVGILEALLIRNHLHHKVVPRPLTHDLIYSAATAMGGVFEDVVICDLKEDVYYAFLRIKQNGKMLEIDCRPSDAIAVAVVSLPPLKIMVRADLLE